MKKIPLKIWIGTLAAVLVLGGGGYLLVKNQKSKSNNQGTSSTSSTDDKSAPENTKGDNAPQPNSEENKPVAGLPETTTNIGSLPNLEDVSLTVYLNAQATTSMDGKTVIPANSITAYFYLPSGIYTVQKMVGASWQNVATNINYPGHGGLSVPFIAPTEDNVSYRVVKIENGNPKSVSKTFVVKRSDLSGGMKTYN